MDFHVNKAYQRVASTLSGFSALMCRIDEVVQFNFLVLLSSISSSSVAVPEQL